MRELSTSQKFWYVVRAVLLSPLSVAVWAAGGALSYWAHSPFLLGVPALFTLVLIFARLRSEEYLRHLFEMRETREQNLSEQEIENQLEQMDFETRQRIRYILQLQKEISREARGKDVESYTRTDLDRIASQLAPLVQQAVRIAVRKQQLTRYLHNVDEKALRNYCANLEQRVKGTPDPVAKAQYEQALKSRQMELQTYQAIAQAAGRIDSQLENVEATFASWKAKVIRIKSADVASASSVSEGVFGELESLSSDIDVLDRSVTQALASDEELALQQNQGNRA